MTAFAIFLVGLAIGAGVATVFWICWIHRVLRP